MHIIAKTRKKLPYAKIAMLTVPYSIIMTWFTDMVAGNSVSVYADIDGACRKGMNKPFEGRKLFAGNGTVQLSRDDIYRAEGGQR